MAGETEAKVAGTGERVLSMASTGDYRPGSRATGEDGRRGTADDRPGSRATGEDGRPGAADDRPGSRATGEDGRAGTRDDRPGSRATGLCRSDGCWCAGGSFGGPGVFGHNHVI